MKERDGGGRRGRQRKKELPLVPEGEFIFVSNNPSFPSCSFPPRRDFRLLSGLIGILPIVIVAFIGPSLT